MILDVNYGDKEIPEALSRTQRCVLHFERGVEMATNPPKGDGHRNGAVRDRSQTYNLQNDRWTKRDAESGKFIDQKADPKPFKGVRKEK